MAKNIEMNTLNESGEYEVVYPMVTVDNIVNYDDTFLSNATKIILDLDNNATPDEALLKLAMGEDKNAALVTVKYYDEYPASGITISGYTDYFGNSAVTNENGQCVIVSDTDSFTFGLTSPYVNISNIASATYQAEKPITKIDLIFESNGITRLEVTSSKTIQFYHDVSAVDVFAVGGGGAGACVPCLQSANGSYATGGAGGYTSTVLNKTVVNPIVCNIGSGGARGYSKYIDTSKQSEYTGGKGGTTSVSFNGTVVVSATGGDAGTGTYKNGTNSPYGANGAKGGSGSGAVSVWLKYSNNVRIGASSSNGGTGGSATLNSTTWTGGAGQETTTAEFGEEGAKTYSGAGGGTANCRFNFTVGTGADGGGNGAYTTTDEITNSTSTVNKNNGGTNYGCGGGAMTFRAIGSDNGTTWYSGSGYQGIVIFRWTY